MTVGVLGGGPAGAFAAERLASAGVKTLLIDEKLAWEKPCGGGLTWKAYTQYPFLAESSTPRKTISSTVLAAPGLKPAEFRLDRPILIYSRRELNGMLLDRAADSGAQIQQTRVLGMDRDGTGWRIRTKSGEIAVDYCVVATGARNPLRDYGTSLTPSDTMSALGYHVPGERDRIDLAFLEGLEGYIWVFPRCGHMSVGICGKGESAGSLRDRLHNYMETQGLSREGAAFYSHVLPSLDLASWKSNRFSGDGWLAVGDAAGLVDPITGEGLYYAVRSADLAVQAILGGTGSAGHQYSGSLAREIVPEMEFASRIARRVFRGAFLGRSVPQWMILATRRSPTFRVILGDLFAGTQPYLELKRRLTDNGFRMLLELVLQFASQS